MLRKEQERVMTGKPITLQTLHREVQQPQDPKVVGINRVSCLSLPIWFFHNDNKLIFLLYFSDLNKKLAAMVT
jgi:hypothetical protein